MYVKVDQYQELLSTLAAIDAKLQGVEKTIERITLLKAEEDKQLGLWNENLTDIKARVGRVKEAFSRR
jgi:hypothetical protein